MELLSIVIPVYNVELYLRQCLESVVHQTYTNLEIVLIDDGSTDGSAAICREFAEADSRVRLVRQENGGLVAAVKRGVATSTGKWISFVDADDWVESELFATLMSHEANCGADLIATQFVRDEQQMKGSGARRMLTRQEYLPTLVYERGYQKTIINARWGKLFRTRLLQERLDLLQEDVTMGEDQQLLVAYLLAAESAAVVDYYGYHYRTNLSSMTHCYKPNLLRQITNLMDSLECMTARDSVDFSAQITKEWAIYAVALLENAYYAQDRQVRRQEYGAVFGHERILRGIAEIDRRDLSKYYRQMFRAIRRRSALSVSFWIRVNFFWGKLFS